ncbi:MAG: GH3 auxin-responsive promoter family protein, partial [Sediminibacterium sp.]|nr:GH3 auxin-responsive promoter family protein [Sediminibacterium sp.]
IKKGKKNILWRGKPIYFAKTSGTTSGIKYIPITKDSISNHIISARNAILCYIAEKKDASLVGGKMIFLSGSPILQKLHGIFIGRLSGIVNHHIPAYLRSNQLPSFKTNCIEDWETKIEKIVAETMDEDMQLISGIPPWMIMYFEKLMAVKNTTIHQIFPNLKLLIHGGVNFQPYKQKIDECIGKKIDCIELFPASEGFFAFQNTLLDDGLLLNINSGIFYEFIPIDELSNINPTRINLSDVELNKQYALIVSSYAGLWGYNVGDTIKFVSLNPYKIRVTGRIKHFISAFGEHVITEEVEKSIIAVSQKFNIQIKEFTVAPLIKNTNNESYHEWYIEFDEV